MKIEFEGLKVELFQHRVLTKALAEIAFIAVETHDKEKWQALSSATQSMKAGLEMAGLTIDFPEINLDRLLGALANPKPPEGRTQTRRKPPKSRGHWYLNLEKAH